MSEDEIPVGTWVSFMYDMNSKIQPYAVAGPVTFNDGVKFKVDLEYQGEVLFWWDKVHYLNIQ